MISALCVLQEPHLWAAALASGAVAAMLEVPAWAPVAQQEKVGGRRPLSMCGTGCEACMGHACTANCQPTCGACCSGAVYLQASQLGPNAAPPSSPMLHLLMDTLRPGWPKLKSCSRRLPRC